MAQQQWNPTRVSFNDANQMMQGASQSYQNASDYFTKLGDSILAEERQKAVDAQNKLLFDQQQEERKYQQDVRAAKGVMAEGLREGPQTSFLDMNPWAEANGKKLEGMELFSTVGADGKLIHTDGAGRVITDAGEITARQEQQAKLGALLDTAEYKQVESRPEMLSRIIGEAKNKNLPITDLVAALEEARGAELTTQDKEKTAAQAAVDSKKKALSDLMGSKRGTYEKYNFEPLGTIVEGTVSTSEDDEFGTKAKGRDAQAAWKEKKEALKGMTGTAAITSTQGLKDEVIGMGTSLASALGISDEDRVQKYMELTKDIAAPEVAANYARMYGVDKGFFSGSSLKNPEEIRNGLLQYVASLDKVGDSGGSGGSGHSTSLKSSTNRFTTKGGADAQKIEMLYSPQEKALLQELAAAERSLAKANMTPAQKAAAKYATADKETRAIMDWRYKGAVDEVKSVLPADTTPKSVAAVTKVLASVVDPSVKSTKAEKKAAIETVLPSMTVSKPEKMSIVADINKSARVLTAEEKRALASWEKDASGAIDDNLLGPVTDVLFAKLLKPAATLTNNKILRPLSQQLAKTRYGQKLVEKVDDLGRNIDAFDVPSYTRNTGPKVNVLPSTPVRPTALKSSYSGELNLDAPTILRHGPKPPIKQGPAFRQTR